MRRAHIPYSLPRNLTQQIKFASPNIHELRAIATALDFPVDQQPLWNDDLLLDPTANAADQSTLFQSIKHAAAFVSEHIEHVVVTLGPLGVLIASRGGSNQPRPFFTNGGDYIAASGSGCSARFYAGRTFNRIVNVSGAGDSFTSGFITATIRGNTEAICVSVGFEAAGSALMSRGAVPDKYFDVQHSCWKTAAAFDVI